MSSSYSRTVVQYIFSSTYLQVQSVVGVSTVYYCLVLVPGTLVLLVVLSPQPINETAKK
jgi:hypothetical protein